MSYPLADIREIPDLDPYLRQVMQLSYLDRRRFVWRQKKQFPHRYLYKYRTLARRELVAPGESPFTDQSIDRLRTVLVDSHLRLSSPAAFNDPFDMHAQLKMQATPKQRLKRYIALVDSQLSDLTAAQREDAVAKLMNEPAASQAQRISQSFEKHRDEFGIYCFAAGDPRDILMWSHYCADHTGICLQFECAKDVPFFSRAIRVKYLTKYPTVNWFHNFQKSLSRSMGTKHRRWKYEDERRIVLDGQANKFIKFDPSALVGVIFGCRAGRDVHDAVVSLLHERSALGHPPLKGYFARQNKFRFTLDFMRT